MKHVISYWEIQIVQVAIYSEINTVEANIVIHLEGDIGIDSLVYIVIVDHTKVDIMTINIDLF